MRAILRFIGECVILLVSGIGRLFRRPWEVRETIEQMAFIGVASVPIVALTTFFYGAVFALYTTQLLVEYGASGLTGATTGLAVTREIGPVLAGIMVAARCGSAMTAQIGTMAVTEQIDAVRALGVNPIGYLVTPRLVAATVMMPVLALLGVYAGLSGGYMVAVLGSGVPTGAFIDSLQRFLEPMDFAGAIIKATVFGLLVTVVSVQQGFATQGGAVGVGRATTNSVVITMVLIYVANYFLSAILY